MLSEYGRKKKVEEFLRFIPKGTRIVEAGSVDGLADWYLRSHRKDGKTIQD